MLRNCFLDFAVEHWFGTEPGFAGDIGAIEVWLIDWLNVFNTWISSASMEGGDYWYNC